MAEVDIGDLTIEEIPAGSQIIVNGVAVNNFLIRWTVEAAYGHAIAVAHVELVKNATSLVTFTPNQTVDIYRYRASNNTSRHIFSGNIERIEQEPGLVRLVCNDKLWVAVKLNINYLYDYATDTSAGVVSSIFKDLCDRSSLSYTTTSVTSTTTGYPVVQKFACRNVDLFDRMQKLADTVNFYFWYRPTDDLVYFQPKGLTTNSTGLTVGSNVVKVPQWKTDMTEMINVVNVLGDSPNVQYTKAYTGDAATTVFDCVDPNANKIRVDSIRVQITGVDKTGGTPGSTSSYDYYLNTTRDANGVEYDQVVFTVAPAGAAAITFIQDYGQPVRVRRLNQASIAAYGQYERVITNSALRNNTDAAVYAQTMLNVFSYPFYYTELEVKDPDSGLWEIGQQVTVTDAYNSGVTGTYTVNQITFRYPEKSDIISVGNKEWKLADWGFDINKQIQSLQQEASSNTQYLSQYIDFLPGVDNTKMGVKITAASLTALTLTSGTVFEFTGVEKNVNANITGVELAGSSAVVFSETY